MATAAQRIADFEHQVAVFVRVRLDLRPAPPPGRTTEGGPR